LARDYTKWVVQEVLGWQEFEDLCTSYLYGEHGYRDIRQVGRVGDQGRDAVVLWPDHRERIVFAYSKEKSPLSGKSAKFFRDYERWRGSGIEQFVFVSSQDLGASKIDTPKGLDDPPAVIYDITDLMRFLDQTPQGLEVKRQHGFDMAGSASVAAASQATETDIPPPVNQFTVLSLEDVSHAAAKRYTANILITPAGSREQVRLVVAEAVAEFRSAEIFRNEITKRYWAGLPAQAIWLFVYQSLDDVPHINWICRCQWLSPQLTGTARRFALKGDEEFEGVVIDWNEQYRTRAEFAKTHTVSHETYLSRLDDVIVRLEPLMTEALGLNDRYQRGTLGNDSYVAMMCEIEPQVSDLYRQSGHIGLAPTRHNDLSQAFQQLMAMAHNVVLPFSARGLKTWPQRNRDFVVRSAIEGYVQEVARVHSLRQGTP
jgi:hypothetical protein